MKHDWIQTLSGVRFCLHPAPSDLVIMDIAHSLATEYRFARQSPIPYSVAQHSVLVSRCCVNRQWGLLHDAAEAYLGDMPSPFKKEITGYKRAEARIMRAVAERFGLEQPEPEEVHRVDLRMRATERRDLLTIQLDWASLDRTQDLQPFPFTIRPWGWRRAERAFLDRFNELF